ncbi:hypothetical protein R3P38DRAFT_3224398 [Favolaschia claudopus]|uniref:Uncharacterized protein n=1 Tax=Favolaschia claudopus TaxID=2862362 RepID=A0AAV9ZW52_9AGAR
MLRVACPEKFSNGGNNVSLQACVEHVFKRVLQKVSATSYDWSRGVPAITHPRYTELVTYAALDAEASLALYQPVRLMVLQKSLSLWRHIPDYWYTFAYDSGNSVRMYPNVYGVYQDWSFVDCPWFIGGNFNGYWM